MREADAAIAVTLTPKQRVMRGEPYTPPKLSPEEERERREMVTWHAQKGLHFANQALERANSNQEREAAIKEIQMFTEMLDRNKEKP